MPNHAAARGTGTGAPGNLRRAAGTGGTTPPFGQGAWGGSAAGSTVAKRMSDSASRQKGSPPSDRRPDPGGGTWRRVPSRTRRARYVVARDLFPVDESSVRAATLAVLALVAAVVAVMRLDDSSRGKR